MGREVKNNQGSDWTGHRVGRKREEETATQSDTRHTCKTRPRVLVQDLILDKDGDHPESEQQYTGEGLYAVRPSSAARASAALCHADADAHGPWVRRCASAAAESGARS